MGSYFDEVWPLMEAEHAAKVKLARDEEQRQLAASQARVAELERNMVISTSVLAKERQEAVEAVQHLKALLETLGETGAGIPCAEPRSNCIHCERIEAASEWLEKCSRWLKEQARG
jgi:hypothetical protein